MKPSPRQRRSARNQAAQNEPSRPAKRVRFDVEPADPPVEPPPAKRAPAKRAPAKRAPAKRAPAKRAPAKRAPAKRAPAKRAPAKKAAAKAKPAPAKEAATPAKPAPAKPTSANKAASSRRRRGSFQELSDDDLPPPPHPVESVDMTNNSGLPLQRPLAPIANTVPPEVERVDPPPPPPYLVTYTVLWKEKLLIENTRIINDFNYQDFHADGIQRASKEAEKTGDELVIEKAGARILQDGKTKSAALMIPAECGTIEEWDHVKKLVRHLQAEYTGRISVHLKHSYSAKVKIPTNETAPGSSATLPGPINQLVPQAPVTPSQPATLPVPPKVAAAATNKKKRKTPTERMIEDMEKVEAERPRVRAMKAITQRWRCSEVNCSNKNHWCWTPQGPQYHHHFIHHDALAKWAKAVFEGKEGVSTDEPPEKLKRNWFAQLEAQRKGQKRQKAEAERAAASPSTAAGHGVTVNVNQQPHQPPPWPYQGLHGPYNSGYPGQYIPYHAGNPPPSSPVQVDGDPGEALEAYMNWQISKVPSQEKELRDAFKKLRTDLYTTTDIRTFGKDDWDGLHIQRGLGSRLQRDVKEWVASRMRRSKSSSLSSSGASSSSSNTDDEPLDTRIGQEDGSRLNQLADAAFIIG